MKGGRSLLSLSGSIVLHGLAVLAAVALLAPEAPSPALIVELGEAIRVGEPASSPGPARINSGAADRARPRRPAPRSEPATAAGPLVPTGPALPTALPSGAQPEPSPGPPSLERAVPPVPAPTDLPPSQPEQAGGGSTPDSIGGGTPGLGPLAMLASAGRGEGVGLETSLAAISPGAGEGGMPAEFGPYLQAFRQRIQELLHYPLAARRRGLGGTVQLEIELLPTGKVTSVVVRSSSSHAVLDQAALDTVRGLLPVPFPSGVPSRPLKVRVPIVFELR